VAPNTDQQQTQQQVNRTPPGAPTTQQRAPATQTTHRQLTRGRIARFFLVAAVKEMKKEKEKKRKEKKKHCFSLSFAREWLG
jgi:hypothetical protein